MHIYIGYKCKYIYIYICYTCTLYVYACVSAISVCIRVGSTGMHICRLYVYCICVGYTCTYNCRQCVCYVLTFWPGQKIPFKVMHRKEVIHSNGSYERKSRGRKLADEMGRGKNIPWYSHRLTHRKRVTSELHDSYFRLMTIKHSISKIEWAIV